MDGGESGKELEMRRERTLVGGSGLGVPVVALVVRIVLLLDRLRIERLVALAVVPRCVTALRIVVSVILLVVNTRSVRREFGTGSVPPAVEPREEVMDRKQDQYVVFPRPLAHRYLPRSFAEPEIGAELHSVTTRDVAVGQDAGQSGVPALPRTVFGAVAHVAEEENAQFGRRFRVEKVLEFVRVDGDGDEGEVDEGAEEGGTGVKSKFERVNRRRSATRSGQ